MKTILTTALRKAATLSGCLVLVAVALFAAAGVLAWKANDLNDDPVLANRALIDEADSEKLVNEVTRGLTTVLSYDWADPEATKAIADRLLQGQAKTEYELLFKSLQERAPGQKLTLTARIQVVGVQELSADRASLLVFLDQASSRETDKEQSVSAAQLSITAERKGGNWAIIGLKAL